jgi:hypothetical protein
MTDAEMSMTCGFKQSGRFDLAGTGIVAPGVKAEQWQRAIWATGTASGQVDLVARAERTVAAGTYEELDLFGGLILDAAGATITALKDVTGDAATFQTLRAIFVQIVTGAVGLRVGGAATNPHTLWFGGTAPTHDLDATGPPFAAGGPLGKAVSATVRRVRLLNLDGAATLTYRVALGGIKV